MENFDKDTYSKVLNSYEDIKVLDIGSNNGALKSAAHYYYDEEQPTDTSYNYWHYVDGVPTKWEIG